MGKQAGAHRRAASPTASPAQPGPRCLCGKIPWAGALVSVASLAALAFLIAETIFVYFFALRPTIPASVFEDVSADTEWEVDDDSGLIACASDTGSGSGSYEVMFSVALPRIEWQGSGGCAGVPREAETVLLVEWGLAVWTILHTIVWVAVGLFLDCLARCVPVGFKISPLLVGSSYMPLLASLEMLTGVPFISVFWVFVFAEALVTDPHSLFESGGLLSTTELRGSEDALGKAETLFYSGLGMVLDIGAKVFVFYWISSWSLSVETMQQVAVSSIAASVHTVGLAVINAVFEVLAEEGS